MSFLLGGGTRLTPALRTDAALSLEGVRRLPEGTVELTYACG
jgi:hypothetical protein